MKEGLPNLQVAGSGLVGCSLGGAARKRMGNHADRGHEHPAQQDPARA